MPDAEFIRWATDIEALESGRATTDGLRLAWFTSGRAWRFPEGDERERLGCRHTTAYPSCPNRPDAILIRDTTRGPRRYGYCRDHMYGNRIEDGRIISLRLIAESEPS